MTQEKEEIVVRDTEQRSDLERIKSLTCKC